MRQLGEVSAAPGGSGADCPHPPSPAAPVNFISFPRTSSTNGNPAQGDTGPCLGSSVVVTDGWLLASSGRGAKEAAHRPPQRPQERPSPEGSHAVVEKLCFQM